MIGSTLTLVLFAATALPAGDGAPESIPAGPETLLPPVRVVAAGEYIDVGSCIAYAGPRLEDLDGDGVAELLVGDFSGHIHVHRNTGTKTAPVWAAGERLEAEGKGVQLPNW